MEEILESFFSMSVSKQKEEFDSAGDKGFLRAVDMIYADYPSYKLLVSCSPGNIYSDFNIAIGRPDATREEKDSPIVILDEATASVDADNERPIQEAISELCKDKTLLVIAHRLKTIRYATPDKKEGIIILTDATHPYPGIAMLKMVWRMARALGFRNFNDIIKKNETY